MISRLTTHGSRLILLTAFVLVSTLAMAFNSNEISLLHFVLAERQVAGAPMLLREDNISGSGNSGAVIANGRLFALEQEAADVPNGDYGEACIREFSTDPATFGDELIEVNFVDLVDNDNDGVPDAELVLGDFEGITYCSGSPAAGPWVFAVVHETSGDIYKFDMNAVLAQGNNGDFDIVANNLGIKHTGIVTLAADNDGLEGIAYDPVLDIFYVAKQDTSNSFPRGVYHIPANLPVSSPQIPFYDPGVELSGLELVGDYLYVVSKDSQILVRARLTSSNSVVEHTRDLFTDSVPATPTVLEDGYEGVAVDPATGLVYLIGENSDTAANGGHELAAFEVDPKYDFDGNHLFDQDDIDLFSAEIESGAPNILHDYNFDGVVDAEDFDFFIETLLYTFSGDADLNRVVDVGDLNTVGSNWQQAGAHLGWLEGDFVDNDTIDADDLNEVGINWQKSKSLETE